MRVEHRSFECERIKRLGWIEHKTLQRKETGNKIEQAYTRLPDLTGLNKAFANQDAIAAMNPCPQVVYGDLSGLSSRLARSGLPRIEGGMICRPSVFIEICFSARA
jgi:hypothetical protein